MLRTAEANRSLNLTTPPTQQKACDILLDTPLAKAIQTVAYSLLLIFSLIGNSLVIAVIWRNRRLRTIINLFVASMAISDLLLPLFALPREIKNIYLPYGLWLIDGIFGSITCKFMPFAEDLSIIVSVLTMEIIAIERFFSIVFPMKRQPINSKKTCFITIALTWCIGAIYPSIHFYKYKLIYVNAIPYCLDSWEPAFAYAEAIKIEFPIYLVCFSIIPFIFLTILYSATIVSLHRQKLRLHLASETRQRRAKKYRRITYMLVTVVVVFLVAWLPFNVYVFLATFVWSSQGFCESELLISFAVFLLYTYPSINPLIYYIFNESYRKGFKQLLRSLTASYKSCCKNNRDSARTASVISYTVEHGSSNVACVLSMRSLEDGQLFT